MAERVDNPIGYLFDANYNPKIEAVIAECKDKCWRYNQLSPNDREGQMNILSGLLGGMGKHVTFVPPFWCDYGYNISVGDYFYANHNLVVTDGAKVTFGDNVFIAPNCCFTTAEHAIDPEQRKAGMEVAKPIVVGNNVWIGAGSTSYHRGQYRHRRRQRGKKIDSGERGGGGSSLPGAAGDHRGGSAAVSGLAAFMSPSAVSLGKP